MSNKISYRVRNWTAYNRALVNRGNITLWFSDDIVDHWQSNDRTGKRGRPLLYSEVAIELCLTLRFLYHLPLRGTQGFVSGLISMLALTLKTPDYSLLCKRGGKQKVDLLRIPPRGKVDIVVDSSGLKVYGEGEWQVRTHGKGKRRVWKKIHISADPSSGEIVAISLTDSKVDDASQLSDLLPITENLANVYGDGAFDNQKSYDEIAGHKAKPKIPPRHGAALTKNPSWGMVERNINIRGVWLLGRKLWKQASGYHRRSLAETTVGRYKGIFGGRLCSRKAENQIVESRIKAQILNRMTHLGMPESYKTS